MLGVGLFGCFGKFGAPWNRGLVLVERGVGLVQGRCRVDCFKTYKAAP